LVDYGKAGIKMYQKTDSNKLTNASDNFKKFIESKLPAKYKMGGSCIGITNERVSNFDVLKIYKDSFAQGSRSCVGPIVWVKENGHWSEVEKLGGAEIPLCSDVISYGVPPVIIKECRDDSKSVSDYDYDIIKNPN
jgi:hypothetical protein